MTPAPGIAPATIAEKPFALRAQAFPSTVAAPHPAGLSGNINTNNNRREVGPLQASAVGPLQTAAPTKVLAFAKGSFSHTRHRFSGP